MPRWGHYLWVYCATDMLPPLAHSPARDLWQFPGLFVVCTYVPNAGAGLKRLQYRVDVWDTKFSQLLQVGLRARDPKRSMLLAPPHYAPPSLHPTLSPNCS